MSYTIDEFKTRKAFLEDIICNLTWEFEKNSQVSVESIDLSKVQYVQYYKENNGSIY